MINFQIKETGKIIYSPSNFKLIQMLQNGDRVWINNFAYIILQKSFDVKEDRLTFLIELA